MISAEPSYLTSHQIADLISVSPSTVLSWIDKRLLPAFRTPGGHRRVERAALVQFLRHHQMPVPRELVGVARLLIIDDETVFLRTARRQLKRAAPWLVVETAESAADALLKVGTFHADAVVLDAMMPGMDGIEVCGLLRSGPETAHIMVVALTGYSSSEIEAGFKRAGAVAVLQKPLDPAALLQILSERGLRKEAR
ncbi:MAG: response regulator [Myxococcales bacterium]|nr:response regulator [Myxococcales bacterium]